MKTKMKSEKRKKIRKKKNQNKTHIHTKKRAHERPSWVKARANRLNSGFQFVCESEQIEERNERNEKKK